MIYGVKESWIKLFTIGPIRDIQRVLGFWKDSEVLKVTSESELLSYDLISKQTLNHQFYGVQMQVINQRELTSTQI